MTLVQVCILLLVIHIKFGHSQEPNLRDIPNVSFTTTSTPLPTYVTLRDD